MTKKIINWDKTKSKMFQNRDSENSISSRIQAQNELFRSREQSSINPQEVTVLKQKLFEKLAAKHPITVTSPLTYITDEMSVSQVEDTLQKAVTRGIFKETRKTLPPGTVLHFQEVETGTNTLWFINNSGDEIGIHNEDLVGLLFNTDIRD